MRRLLCTIVLAALATAAAAGTAGARPLAAAASVPPAPCVREAVPQIAVDNGSYNPASDTLGAGHAQGARVTWFWLGGGVSESVTYTGKLALFDSTIRSSGATFSYTFTSAGTYRYHSQVDSTQHGSIIVPLCNVPRTAKVNHAVWVQTSTKSLTKRAEDVEVRRPGATKWKWLKYGFRGIEFSFTPGKTGTYHLRARLRQRSTNATSRFSPEATVKVS